MVKFSVKTAHDSKNIKREELKRDIDMAKMYVQGCDKQGRPVVIFRPANDLDGVGSILTKVCHIQDHG